MLNKTFPSFLLKLHFTPDKTSTAVDYNVLRVMLNKTFPSFLLKLHFTPDKTSTAVDYNVLRVMLNNYVLCAGVFCSETGPATCAVQKLKADPDTEAIARGRCKGKI